MTITCRESNGKTSCQRTTVAGSSLCFSQSIGKVAQITRRAKFGKWLCLNVDSIACWNLWRYVVTRWSSPFSIWWALNWCNNLRRSWSKSRCSWIKRRVFRGDFELFRIFLVAEVFVEVDSKFLNLFIFFFSFVRMVRWGWRQFVSLLAERVESSKLSSRNSCKVRNEFFRLSSCSSLNWELVMRCKVLITSQGTRALSPSCWLT